MTADAVGGVFTYARELARGLLEHDVEVWLAVMGPPPTQAQRESITCLSNVRLFEQPYALEWMENPWEDVRKAGRWLLQLEREAKPHIVHLNGYAHAALPWSAPTLVVGHSCVLSWIEAVRGPSARTDAYARYREEVIRGLLAANLVVTPTRTMLDALKRLYGSFGRTLVIANGRDPSEFTPKPKEPFVFSAGRLWDEAKNLALLGKAALTMPWPAYVAGDAQHPAGGTCEINGARWLGRVESEEMREWLARASVYALPAKYEPFGLSALEAALSGCALVLGAIDSLKEVWGESAFYVHTDDASGLRQVIHNLLSRESLRREMSARARARALEYTSEAMARRYMGAYRQLLVSRVHAETARERSREPANLLGAPLQEQAL